MIIAVVLLVLKGNLSQPWQDILNYAAIILFIGGLVVLLWTILSTSISSTWSRTGG